MRNLSTAKVVRRGMGIFEESHHLVSRAGSRSQQLCNTTTRRDLCLFRISLHDSGHASSLPFCHRNEPRHLTKNCRTTPETQCSESFEHGTLHYRNLVVVLFFFKQRHFRASLGCRTSIPQARLMTTWGFFDADWSQQTLQYK
jgi:hypothetical protein